MTENNKWKDGYIASIIGMVVLAVICIYGIRQLGKEIRSLRKQLKECREPAPKSGSIREIYIEEGQSYTPGMFLSVGDSVIYVPAGEVDRVKKIEKDSAWLGKNTLTGYIPPSQDTIKKMIRPLLIQYYKKGWMDGANGLIDLNNVGKFDNPNVERLKSKHWRAMENKINNQ